MSMRLHRQRHPHVLLSLSRIARVIQIAVELKKLVTGLDPDRVPPNALGRDQDVWADLKRAYG